MWITPAYAAAAPAGGADIFSGILPMVVIFVAFYFILIRPQQKRAKEHKAAVDALQKGDEVLTNGGIAGKVTKLGEQYVTVEIANNTEVQVQRAMIATVLPKGTLKSL